MLPLVEFIWLLNLFFFRIYLCVEIQDPCRPGVKDSVQLCQKAGVKV